MLTPIPYPLSLYVSPAPQSSLTLVTSVLDATSNWLILRYILAALNGQEPPDKNTPVAGSLGYENQENCKVVFVSILRGFEQWREMGKKMEGLEITILQREQGLDFPSLVSSRRLTYINGLIDPAPSQSFPLQNPNVTNFNLDSLQDLENVIISYAKQNQGSVHAFKIILLMDGLDFLLATQPSITSLTLSRTIMTLRQHVHNTIVTASADYPLLHNSSPAATPLEREHRAFVASMAHQSRVVAQLRSLGTGAAKDISGVLRISTGGGYDDVEEHEAGFEEGEWLYQVKGDGSVRVWERGE